MLRRGKRDINMHCPAVGAIEKVKSGRGRVMESWRHLPTCVEMAPSGALGYMLVSLPRGTQSETQYSQHRHHSRHVLSMSRSNNGKMTGMG